MAVGYAAQFAAAQVPAFQQRVQSSAVLAAENISSEPTNTPNHANRVALSRLVLNSGGGGQFPLAIAVQGVDNNSTDAQIDVAVASVWNGIAGT